MVRLTRFKPNEQGGTIPWQRRLPLPASLFGASECNELHAVWGDPVKNLARSALKAVYLLITITVLGTSHPQLAEVICKR